MFDINKSAPILFGLLLAVFCFNASVWGHGADGFSLTADFDSLDSTVLEFHLSSFEKNRISHENRTFTQIGLGSGACVDMHACGHPQLPVVIRSLMIPDSARMKVELLDAEFETIENITIIPHKGPISRTVDPSTVDYDFGEIYEKDAWFPAEAARLREPYILRDVRGVVLEICPFQYNPVQQKLRVYHHMNVEVKANGLDTRNVLDRRDVNSRPDPDFEALYENQFVNYPPDRSDPPPESGDMLIVCHPDFMAAMQPFVDWKNSIGISTNMVDVTTLPNGFPYINTYVQSVYNSSNLSYLLLVGDYNEVKSGYYQGAISDPSYSLVTPDVYPDILVGRFSAETVDDVKTQVLRTICYEQEIHDVSLGGWNAAATGIASAEGLGQGHYGESDVQHADLIRNELLADGFTTVDQIYDPGATASQVVSALNDGRRLVNYIGHGGTSGWSTTVFHNSDIADLTNIGMLPFIHSVGCLGGDFNNGTCFGEAWLRETYNGQPSGAIAAYFASMNQTWAEPMYCQGNHGLGSAYGSAERFWMEMNHSIAGIWYGGSCAMIDLAGAVGRDMFMTWQLFGDPSLRVSGSIQGRTLVMDATTVSLNTPSDTTFSIQAGPDHRGDKYFLLGGVTGTSPGISMPSGLDIPLNIDFFTQMTLAFANTPIFQNFFGVLDPSGSAYPVLSTTGLTPLDPNMEGVMMYYTAVIWPNGEPYEMATNIRILTFVN